MTDWGLALQIGGIGFGVVFLVLCVLATALWLTGVVTSKRSHHNSNEEMKRGQG